MAVVNNFLSQLFFTLGFQIGKNFKIFIVVPVAVFLTLVTGLYNFHFVEGVDTFTISNGTAHQSRLLINKYFPLNSSQKFSPQRLIYPGRFARFIVRGKDGGSIINRKSWSEIEKLDEFVRQISIEWNKAKFNYSQLCATFNGECFSNDHLGVGSLIDAIENGSLRLSYLVMFNPISFETYTIDQLFGGVALWKNSTNRVDTMQATQLHYFLKSDTTEDDDIGIQWERAVIDGFKQLENKWKYIHVSYDTYVTLSIEPESTLFASAPSFAVTSILMVIFTMTTSMTGDWVTSKSFVALMGIISANMGVLASFGVMCFLGVDFLGINLSIPFIALGVGVDDVYVMLAAWKKTSPVDTVPERMAHCYSEAAVSITITTLTDALSFYVGLVSPIMTMKIFCAYAGTAVICIYIWHVFFFGGILALGGYYEKEGRHGLFIWRKVIHPSEAENMSRFSLWLLTDGKKESKTAIKKTRSENHSMMEFFKTSFASILEKKAVQLIIIVVYLLYIGVSLLGISQMQEGMKTTNLAPAYSYMRDYYINFDKYFSKYPHRSQVVVSTELDYSKKETQNEIKNLIGNLTHLKHGTTKYTENWLEVYLHFLENYKEFYDFNITTEQDFIDTLRSYYLTDKMIASEDIRFNENFTKIVATRYIVQYYNGSEITSLMENFIDFRNITNFFKDSLNVTIFSTGDILTETSVILKPITIQLIATAAVIVMAVTIVFIPSVTGIFFVFVSIVTVELGVIGFMVFWNVDLDLISVISLIMCVGFCVDFPAHVCYYYISSSFDTVEERVRDTLYTLGVPILQGGISTMLAVFGLITQASYSPTVFLKIVVLIMTFSVLNALFVLPIFLLIFRPKSNAICSSNRKYVVNK